LDRKAVKILTVLGSNFGRKEKFEMSNRQKYALVIVGIVVFTLILVALGASRPKTAMVISQYVFLDYQNKQLGVKEIDGGFSPYEIDPATLTALGPQENAFLSRVFKGPTEGFCGKSCQDFNYEYIASQGDVVRIKIAQQKLRWIVRIPGNHFVELFAYPRPDEDPTPRACWTVEALDGQNKPTTPMIACSAG
jgi:hypothetical protein